jgi:hypothetical protein
VQIGYWANASEAESTDPQIFTEDLQDVHFQNDREAYTIAFVPEGDDILPPSTVGDLDALAGVDGGDTVATPSTVPTTTTAAGGRGGRGNGATTTTAGGGPATTTSAPPAG